MLACAGLHIWQIHMSLQTLALIPVLARDGDFYAYARFSRRISLLLWPGLLPDRARLPPVLEFKWQPEVMRISGRGFKVSRGASLASALRSAGLGWTARVRAVDRCARRDLVHGEESRRG